MFLIDANSFTIEGDVGVDATGTVVMGHSILEAVNVASVTLGAAGIFTVQLLQSAYFSFANQIAYASQTTSTDSSQFTANLATCVRDANPTNNTVRIFVSDADAGTAMAAPTLPTRITYINFKSPYGVTIPNRP